MMSLSLKASLSYNLSIVRVTLRLRDVLSIVSMRPLTSEFLGWTRTQVIGCLPEKMGCPNKLKKAYFPLSTNLLAPS